MCPRKTLTITAALLAIAATASASGTCQNVIVPLYIYPGTTTQRAIWTAAIRTVGAGHSATMIINPNNGVISGLSAGDITNWTWAINTVLAGTGWKAAAYVHTSYATRALASVEADIQGYVTNFPGVHSVFVDEVSTSSSTSSYYQSLLTYIHNQTQFSAANVILNPGAYPTTNWMLTLTHPAGTTTIVNGWENDYGAVGFNPAPPAWTSSYPVWNFAAIVYDAPSAALSPVLVTSAGTGHMGNIFVTDQTNFVTGLPSYYSSLIAWTGTCP
jgi:hypothetical protein